MDRYQELRGWIESLYFEYRKQLKCVYERNKKILTDMDVIRWFNKAIKQTGGHFSNEVEFRNAVNKHAVQFLLDGLHTRERGEQKDDAARRGPAFLREYELDTEQLFEDIALCQAKEMLDQLISMFEG